MHSLQLTRKALIGKQALYNYNYKKHSAKRRKLASEGDATSYSGLDMASSYVECADVSELTTADDGAVSKTALVDHDCSHVLLKYALQEFPNFECFSSLANRLYFQHQNMENGPSFLVARSQGFSLDLLHSLDELEVRFHLRMASLLCSLTHGQKDDLAAICNLCVNIIQKQVKECNASSTCLPCSSQLMRSLYVKGKNAILPNLPRPSVHFIGDHAYVSLFDCVADLLGHGLDVQHVYNSKVYDVVSSDASSSIFCQSIYKHGIALHCMAPNPLFACMLLNGLTALSHPCLVRLIEVLVGLKHSPSLQ